MRIATTGETDAQPVAGRALHIEGIRKSFPSDQKGKASGRAQAAEFEAIAGVTLQIAAGEFMAIVGPSGCGKSTLLQAIAGLIAPSSGSVHLGDRDVTGEPAHMVYLFQQYAKSLLPWMNVANNVLFAFQHAMPLNRQEANDRCREYLGLVGLGDFADHYPWQLSGGMQQRVAIARALSADPKVLLLDEPFSSVDALTRMDLHTLLLDLWSAKRFTAVLVTHDVDEALFLADRVAVMSHRPSTISKIVETSLPRPRDPISTRDAPRFLALRRQLLDDLMTRPERR